MRGARVSRACIESLNAWKHTQPQTKSRMQLKRRAGATFILATASVQDLRG